MHLKTAVALLILFCATCAFSADTIEVPVLDGDWWKIAEREPDVGEYNNPGKHNACDFTIWQAADSTWQMVACIREVNWPGVGARVFHRWEAEKLTDANWKPMGVFLTPREELHQYASIQAPHCFKYEGKYYFFYNGGTAPGPHIPLDPANPTKGRSRGNSSWCMVSEDGKNFTDIKNTEGSHAFFSMGRDMMVFHDQDRDRFIAYFQDTKLPGETPDKNGAMYFRTAPKPEGPWSKERTNINNKGNPESPFVIKRGDKYYLWEQMKVFVSDTPEDFSDRPNTKMTPGPVHGKYAPEILLVDDRYYIAGYETGIWLCKMKWVEKTKDEINEWRRSFGIAE
jgi:hypothetical protein